MAKIRKPVQLTTAKDPDLLIYSSLDAALQENLDVLSQLIHVDRLTDLVNADPSPQSNVKSKS